MEKQFLPLRLTTNLRAVQLNYRYERMLEEKEALLKECKAELYDKDLEISGLREELTKLTATISTLEEDKKELGEELQQKDQIILFQENKMSQFKTIKSDCDRTISELRDLLESTEKENMKLTMHAKEMEKEFFHVNADKHYTILDSKSLLDSARKENDKQKQKVFDLEVTINRLQAELHKCSRIQEPKLLKEKVCELYQRYARPGYKLDVRSFDEDQKYIQHTRSVESSIAILKRELARERASHNSQKQHFMKENMMLMTEIRELRKQLKAPHTGIQRGQNSAKKQTMDCREVQPARKSRVEERTFVLPFAQAKRLEEKPGRINSLRLPSIAPRKS